MEENRRKNPKLSQRSFLSPSRFCLALGIAEGAGAGCSVQFVFGSWTHLPGGFSPISTEPCTPRLKALLRGAVRAHYPEGLIPLEEGRKAETTSENEERRPTDEMCIRREKDSIKKDTIKNFKTHLAA